MSRVVHFEIGADDVQRAVRFYSEVFGWKIDAWGGPMEYYLATTGEPGEMGIDGAIMPRPDPNMTTINTIGVASIEESCDKIIAAGGKVVTPKAPIPGVGYFANCLDSEGNPIGVLQPDPNAQ